jgi:four helix bundle protein
VVEERPQISRIAVNSYQDLKVWQEAMTLAVECYKLTRSFPKDELFGMTGQIRRSAASVAANVAEGYGREKTRVFVQFLRMAQGSLKELETRLLLAQRAGIARDEVSGGVLVRCDALGRMLRPLIRSLQKQAGTL